MKESGFRIIQVFPISKTGIFISIADGLEEAGESVSFIENDEEITQGTLTSDPIRALVVVLDLTKNFPVGVANSVHSR